MSSGTGLQHSCDRHPHTSTDGRPGVTAGGPVFSLLVLFLFAWTVAPARASPPAEDLSHPDQGRTGENEAVQFEDDIHEPTGRSFLYKEAVLSLSLSRRSSEQVEPSHRPPGSYLALDYVRTFTPASRINRKLPGWLQLTATDLHPRLVYYGKMPEFDPDSMAMMEGDADWPMPEGDEVFFAPQDLWIRFQLAGRDRLTLRFGQIILPYGVNPILAPRQSFIMPVEAHDLGLKWDWGIGLKGPLRKYDWELAATLGSGEVWHTPSALGGSRPPSYLFTGRVGTPTYWDLQHGVSFLVGELPTLHGPYLVDEFPLSRWRVSLDSLYKVDTFLFLGAQVTYGRDGYAGDEEHVLINGGSAAAEILGYRAFLDWVPEGLQNLRIAGQIESLIRDLQTPDTTEAAAILEIGYSLTTEITLKIAGRAVISDFMGSQDEALYLTLVYYGR